MIIVYRLKTELMNDYVSMSLLWRFKTMKSWHTPVSPLDYRFQPRRQDHKKFLLTKTYFPTYFHLKNMFADDLFALKPIKQMQPLILKAPRTEGMSIQ